MAALRRRVTIAMVLLVLSALGAPQRAWLVVADSPIPQRPTFRAGAEYVVVDVVVTDTDDRPITDLAVDDFEVFEDRRRQTVADFVFMGTPVMHRRDVDAIRLTPAAVDVVTNTPPPRSSRLFVMIIDDLHVIETDIAPIRRLITDFLSEISPEDQVAIVFAGHSDLAVDFTNDLSVLLRAVDNISESVGFGHDARPPGRDYLGQARSTISTLGNVVRSLAKSGRPRSAVVFVSDSFTIDPNIMPCSLTGGMWSANSPFAGPPCSDMENRMAIVIREELQAVYEDAARAGVPVYTIDPRGVATPENSVRGWVGRSDVSTEIARRIRIQQGYLSEIAVNTGGRAFVNRSNLTQAMSELIAENGSYYLLGYYPDPYHADGKFHQIDVHVRRRGVRVRARRGYVAVGPDARPTPGRQSLDAALGSVRPGGDIALRAFAAPLTKVDTGTRTVVMVEAAYPPAPEPGDDEILMSVLAVDPDGRTRAESHRTITMHVPSAGDGPRLVALGDLVVIPKGRVTLRIGIASGALGGTATVYLPLDVPDMSAGALELGGLVLASDHQEPPPAAVPLALQRLVPFQPTLMRQFATAETLRIFTHVQWDTAEGEPVLTITVRGEKAVSTSDVALAGVTVLGRETDGTVDTVVPLAGLAPGPYTLEVAAHLDSGQTAVRRVGIEVR